MKGSKHLSEMVDISMFQKGTLNLIEAPTGCGKTYFALKYIPSHVKNSAYKVAFLIDTTNGREQAIKRYHLNSATLDWQEAVKTGMIDFGDTQNIVAMTYAKFGKMCEEDASFVDKLEYIICDEMHNLINYSNIKSNNHYHETALEKLDKIAMADRTTVIAMTATPRKIKDKMKCQINKVQLDYTQLLSHETRQTILYNSLKTIFSKVLAEEIGLCYTKRITTMQKIEAEAVKAGLTPICIWSTNNKDHPLTEEQLAARKELLEQSAIPERYNLLIVNSSCETSIKIESPVDYVIVNSRDKDSQIQVRGRVDNDLELLYLPSNVVDSVTDDMAPIEVPEKYLGRKLFTEDRAALCEDLCIYKKGKNEIYKWKGIRPLLVKSGYLLQDDREGNRHYTIITLPE